MSDNYPEINHQLIYTQLLDQTAKLSVVSQQVQSVSSKLDGYLVEMGKLKDQIETLRASHERVRGAMYVLYLLGTILAAFKLELLQLFK
jgi:hypothetical protein